MITIEAHQPAALAQVAESILAHFGNQRIFAFFGAMGAGKTTLIKAICKQLGATDEVNSPTFSIINEYMTMSYGPLYHFDFYRLNKAEEAFDIGYEHYFYSGSYCFVEWPEKIEQLLPNDYVKVSIEVDESNDKRTITFGR
jgi:tRNA threonylcarbamoyladenosine biosynthesis protein TsaE